MRLSGKHIAIGVLWGVALVALGWFAWARLIAPTFEQSIADTIGPGDYRLETTSGELFTQASLDGGPSAVFFGFTHCPEVCPTTLGDIATWQEGLQAEGRDLRVFFATVDPERDTPDLLGAYVSWVPGVTGLSGDPAEVKKAIEAFRIFAAKVPMEGGGYTMDHSAMVLLFDARGRYAGFISYQEEYDRAMDKLRGLTGA